MVRTDGEEYEQMLREICPSPPDQFGSTSRKKKRKEREICPVSLTRALSKKKRKETAYDRLAKRLGL